MKVSHAVRVIVEPSDNGAALLAAVQAAQTSLHMTMYLLTDDAVISTLVSRHNAGIDVRVLLNQTSAFGSSDNAPAYQTLSAAGVNVHWAPSTFDLTHEKCVIIDGSEAWIMTMNATPTALSSNREFLAIDDDPADVADAEAIFAADFADVSYPSYNGNLVVAPLGAETRLDDLISSATSTLAVEDEELSDSYNVKALIGRAQAGVTVHIVLSTRTPTTAGSHALSQLRAAGIDVRARSTPYIHAKAIVVDGRITYIGSENMTRHSLRRNRELGVITDAPDVAATVGSTIDGDYAAGISIDMQKLVQ